MLLDAEDARLTRGERAMMRAIAYRLAHLELPQDYRAQVERMFAQRCDHEAIEVVEVDGTHSRTEALGQAKG